MSTNTSEAYNNNGGRDPLDDFDLNGLDLGDESGSDQRYSQGHSQAQSDTAQMATRGVVTAPVIAAKQTDQGHDDRPSGASIEAPVAPVAASVAHTGTDPAASQPLAQRTRNRTRKSDAAQPAEDDLDDAILSSAAYRRAAARKAEAEAEMQRTIARLRAADPRNKARRLQALGAAVEATYRKNPAHWAELIKSIEPVITEARDRLLFEEIVKIDADRARAASASNTIPAIGPGLKITPLERPRVRNRHDNNAA